MNQPRSVALDSLLSPLAIALLVLAFLTGGSSMERGWGQVATQLLALPVLWLAVARLLQPPLRRGHAVLLVLAALPPATLALQWALGSSLTPWASQRALLDWLPPLAAFLAALALPPTARRHGLRVLVLLATASLLLASLQLAAPQDSWLNPFPELVPIFNGLFANPNHQGTALGIAAVLLLAAAGDGRPGREGDQGPAVPAGRRQALHYARIGLAVLLLVALPFTGSRAMVLITAAALIMLPLVNGWLPGRWRRESRKARVLVLGLATAAGLALVALSTLGWMRVDRLEEGRSAMTAQTAALAAEAMPLGSGAGSFVPVFEAHLPDAMLIHAWYNHAHNEYVQWWLEGGVAGLAWSVLLLAGFAWARPRRDRPDSAREARDRSRPDGAREDRDRGRPDGAWVGSWLGVGCLLAHSVVDYPLRTPALATAAAWLAATATRGAGLARDQGKAGRSAYNRRPRTRPGTGVRSTATADPGKQPHDHPLHAGHGAHRHPRPGLCRPAAGGGVRQAARHGRL